MLLAAVTGGYAMLVPSGHASAAGSATPSEASAADVPQGQLLYIDGCSSCHGMSGEGVPSRGPSILSSGAAGLDFQMSTGRMPMSTGAGRQPQRKQPLYTDQQIGAIIDYVASLGVGGAAIPDISYWQQADLSQGGELFRTNCAQCHNFAGAGGAMPYGIYAPSLYPATPLQVDEAMLSGPEQMPVFHDSLTAAERLDIVKYVETMKTQTDPGGNWLGRTGPIPEMLVVWLIGVPAVLVVLLWVGSRVSRTPRVATSAADSPDIAHLGGDSAGPPVSSRVARAAWRGFTGFFFHSARKQAADLDDAERPDPRDRYGR